MRLSRRLEKLPMYLFAEIDKKIAEKRSEGIDVISFGEGDPDIPTPAPIVETLAREARKAENHRYPSYFGLPEFRETISSWFKERFQVELDPETEILPLIGSKEGIAHLPLALLDEGDTALLPEPGYPVYNTGVLLAGATPIFIPLLKENEFLPHWHDVDDELADDARLMYLNYPNNPTGAVASRDFFSSAVEFAREHSLVIAHDNAYSEITYDGFSAPSLLEISGARELAIEFHSLSKTYNMTGWRVGFVVGNAELIGMLAKVKTNIDSGIFNPIQKAAMTALELYPGMVEETRDIYRRRRDLLVDSFKGFGWQVTKPLGALYLWMEIPEGQDSVSFSTEVLDQAGLFFTPGSAYGPSGEGFVRISLTVDDERIQEAISRLEDIYL